MLERTMILLNGPSSAGKSTLSRVLQNRLREMNADPLIISIDDYMRTDPKETIYEDDIYEIMPDMCRDTESAIEQGRTVVVDHPQKMLRSYWRR